MICSTPDAGRNATEVRLCRGEGRGRVVMGGRFIQTPLSTYVLFGDSRMKCTESRLNNSTTRGEG
jgi:hypothetical protein